MRDLWRRGAVLLVVVGMLAGCGFISNESEGADVDLTEMEAALVAASPRVVGVERSERRVDGLGHALYVNLRLDSDAVVAAEDLDVIVEALWRSVPWEPNGISVVVGEVEAGAVPVDLRAAAADLEPLVVRPYGRGGVSLGRMWDRYGAWESPE